MVSKIETLVIHLARAEGRRSQVERLLEGTPYPARIVDAVDGTLVPKAARDATTSVKPLFSPAYPFPIGPGEYGCFQSHRKAWKMILDEGLDAALILEDDVALTPVFAETVAFAAEEVRAYGYVQFSNPKSGCFRSRCPIRQVIYCPTACDTIEDICPDCESCGRRNLIV